MGHSNETPTIGLPLFSDEDKPTWLGDMNDMSRKIDSAVENYNTQFATLTNADTTLRNDFTAADAAIRNDFVSADATLRQDFTAADSAIRTDFTTADAALSNNKVDKGALLLSVKDYGAQGDGTTDDTKAFQDALNAAGEGGCVIVPKGRYVVGRLTMPNAFAALIGWVNAVGTGTSSATEIIQSSLKSRSVTDASTTSGSKTLTSATAAFTNSDVGSYLTGNGIPDGTIISSVQSATQVTMSIAATATASAVSVTIAEIGLTLNSSCRVENLLFRANSNSTNVAHYSAYPTCRFRGVQYVGWKLARSLYNVWYGVDEDCEYRACGEATVFNNCYNYRLMRPQINGQNGSVYGNGFRMVGQCMISLYGGSIENTQIGFTMTGLSSLHINGTYWESLAPNAVGVNAAGINGHLLSIHDCEIYINNYLNWVDFQNTDSATLEAGGNFFKASGASTPTAPNAYALTAANASEVSLGAGYQDSWRHVALYLAAATYTNIDGTSVLRHSIMTPAIYGNNANDAVTYRLGRNIKIAPGRYIQPGVTTTSARPAMSSVSPGAIMFDTTAASLIFTDGASWRVVQDSSNDVKLKTYVTSARPAPQVGLVIYDTTVGKPIFCDGTNWRDFTGTIV